MPTKSRRNLSVLLAATGLPVMLLTLQPRLALAQYPTGGNGRLLDNNNQLGSGGSNAPTQTHYGNPGLNDAIITGNVTGLNFFHGPVGTYDVNTFQGRRSTQGYGGALAGPSDTLNAISAPVDYSQRTTGIPNFTNYYDASRYTAPTPSNLTVTPGGVGLVPATPVDPLLPNTDNRLTTVLDPNRGNLPMEGEINVSGPVDPTGAASLYKMSPLYGVQQQDNANASNGSFLTPGQANTPMGMSQRRAEMTPSQIQQMRQELNNTVVPSDQNDNTTPQNPNAIPSASSELNGASQVSNPAISTQVPTANLDASSQTNPNGNSVNDLSTGQSLQSAALIPANKQSKQLKALEDKYNKMHKLTDQQAAEKLNAEERILHAAPDKTIKKPGQPTEVPGVNPGPGAAPGANPGTTPMPGGTPDLSPHDAGTTPPQALKPILTPADSAADNHPYVITSLATGIQAKGLGDLMKSAEDKMRQGKFTEAVDTYETAQAVAPNNPFVFLGRSFAELGASYYGKSDQDLTRAVATDAAVLAGKYDLNGFLGEDRVKFVEKDLQDIASHEKSARPLVLLGFISHNTGDDDAAAKYLDQAGPRGGYDSIIALMRSTWGLKSATK